MTVVYMDTDDIYQLFLNFNVPGVRKEAARLAKGVNMGDAGVMGEILQAAYDPSAGQRAMQAGEALQQAPTGDLMQFELAERRLQLKRKAEFDELEIQERRQKLQERQLNMPLEIEERRLKLQERQLSLQLQQRPVAPE